LYRDYWNEFYAKPHPELQEPTPFARYCLERLEPGSRLFELGCGNGRDALFFARHGLVITACDQSVTAIERLNGIVAGHDDWPTPPRFMVSTFDELTSHGLLDAAYSRFTLHAVDAPTATRLLNWSFDNTRLGGKLFIEARTVNGDLYGVGEPAGRDAYVHDGHYRRFIRVEELIVELTSIGFHLDEWMESSGMAVFGADDPVVARIVAIRR
jgi:Tellurite resistance protein TehB.